MSTKKVTHPYHLVDPSPWPLLAAGSAFLLAIGLILLAHEKSLVVLGLGLGLMIFTLVGWWRDVLHEADHGHNHTHAVQRGLKIGMMLFIASEVMFFVSFFWAFFDASLFPKQATGSIWPPKGIHPMDPYHLPYLNTLFLMLSGTSLTWSHFALQHKNRRDFLRGLFITLALGFSFLCVQIFEYSHASFLFTSGIFASTFYMATGFHGVHVCIGAIFLTVCYFRGRGGHFTPHSHLALEAAAWYWHFVDIVWIFLYVSLYWWGTDFGAAQ